MPGHSDNNAAIHDIPASAVQYTRLTPVTEGAPTSCVPRCATHQRLKQVFACLTFVIVFVVVTLFYQCSTCQSDCIHICNFKKPTELISTFGLLNSSRLFQNKDDNHLLQRRFPKAIVFGVRKCGTRALLQFLGLHPDIVPTYTEQHFFNRDKNYAKGMEYYLSQFPPTYENQIGVEKTPGYFISIMAPERIYRMNSSIKLIMIVRDPVTRLISDYSQLRAKNEQLGKNFSTFEEMVFTKTGDIKMKSYAVDVSLYYRHFLRWSEFFQLGQIHIVDGDAMIRDPYKEIYAVESFLGLTHKIPPDIFVYNASKGFYCTTVRLDGNSQCLGETKGREHPAVNASVVEKLRAFYRPYNEKFFSIVQRPFDWI